MYDMFGKGTITKKYDGMKDVCVPTWETRTREILVEIDTVETDGSKTSLFLDREQDGFLIARNCRQVERKEGWTTYKELVGESPERFDDAKSAFARWLEIIG